MRINWHLVAGLALLVCCSWLCEARGSELSEQPAKEPAPRLFRILNFGNFKKLFGKHYKSAVEEISRMRLFLAKCLKSFVSVVKYKQGQETSYKSINHMSDWTDEEFRKTLIKGEVLRGLKRGRNLEDSLANPVEEESVQSAATLVSSDIREEEDVRREMIEATRNLNIALADKSLNELKGAVVRLRRKRDIDAAALQELDTADLMGGFMAKLDRFQHPEIEESPKRVISRRTGSERLSVKKDADLDGPGVRTKLKARKKNVDGLLVDHRNCLPDPVSQKSCGSCYVFAAIAALEYHYCMSTGKMTKFSEQFPLDCGENGCGGGFPETAIDFSVEKGLERAQAWPYLNRRKKCPLKKPNIDPEISGYWHVTGLEKRTVELEEFEEEIVNGPIIVSIDISAGFEDYGGGVDQAKGCTERDEGHCMLVVGHGRENGQDFWLLRNSHGNDWGENGHYKISKRSFAKCYIKEYEHNGWLIEGNIKFKKNRKYDHNFIGKLTKKWQIQLARRLSNEDEE